MVRQAQIEALLAPYSPEVQQLVLSVRGLVLDVMPQATELVDPADKLIGYGFGHSYADLVCAIAPFKAHVNLMLSNGATLPDPTGLLAGTGKRARHVRITETEQISNPDLRELLVEAISDHQR